MDKGKQRELVGSGTIGNVPVMLVKPMTYMNLSGQSVAPLARAAGLKPDRVLVVADDLDLGLGTVRLKTKGSAGGHNGHKSLISSLGSQDYPRIKIGIEKVDRRETIDHVLGGFSPAEREVVDSAIEAAARAVELIVSQKMENALNYLGEFNRSRV
jgi:PTH1 family peptidyl-tRNA hydrolase